MRQRRRRRKPEQNADALSHSGPDGGVTGSPEPEYLMVGQIVRPHGVRGELAMKLMTEYPERISVGQTLYVGEKHRPHRVLRARQHRTGMLLVFKGLTDRDAAEAYREQFVYIHIDDAVPLEDGEYYLFQIEGIQVITDEGQELGRLSGIIETGANDVYIITTPEGAEILIPAIPEVILNVDIPGRIMTIRLLEGLV